jgi:pimeloyl-ACP methyl ester carboxylesterase
VSSRPHAGSPLPFTRASAAAASAWPASREPRASSNSASAVRAGINGHAAPTRSASATKDGWTTGLRAPKSAQNVTLRTGAKDAYGNSVEQTITRAFGLKCPPAGPLRVWARPGAGFSGRGRRAMTQPGAAAGVATTDVLDIAYLAWGPGGGMPVVLLHGFPYDVRSYREVAPLVAAGGARVIVPYLRGYGATRFRSPKAMRSGQQAALAHDLLQLLDALGVAQAIVGGYDWGGRAACIIAALHPERVAGLVTVGGYNVQDIAAAQRPARPSVEKAKWYQHYLQTELGRRGLAENRDDLCHLLWRDWSPTWDQVDAEFALSAPSLHNPDFVDVVVHSYRHRFGAAAGDPAYAAMENRLAERPPIEVPTVSLAPDADGFVQNLPDDDREQFTGRFRGQLLAGVGHNPPQERPVAFAAAITSLL